MNQQACAQSIQGEAQLRVTVRRVAGLAPGCDAGWTVCVQYPNEETIESVDLPTSLHVAELAWEFKQLGYELEIGLT